MALELYFWKKIIIENISSYHTSRSPESSAQLNSFLAGVPTGRIAVALVWKEVHQLLGEDAKLTLESIGSALICNIYNLGCQSAKEAMLLTNQISESNRATV